ncbi:MAG: serine hydrolase [Beijerinckiaceae bacterium]
MRFGCVRFVRKVAAVSAFTGLAAAILVATADPAEAARRKRYRAVYAPPGASMVVDAKTGRVLHAQNADAQRHPASVTKVMTLYLLFEQIERGRFTLDSPLRISANAASQAPSKLGLAAGETIRAEDAIKALVTKSANDIAVAVAENVGGSEEGFAEMMTRKARALGMSRTTFVNASGLPDREQVTTARDLITLGRAIQDRFPKFYHYFGTRSFQYDGYAYRNHNKLLGRVEGVDGIKTGYTRMSGFNLLTSAKADGKHIVAVVLGGRSGRSRDAQMASLVDNYLDRAYAGARIAPVVAEANRGFEEAPRAPSTRMAFLEAPARPTKIEAIDDDESEIGRPVTTASIAPLPPRSVPQAVAAPKPVVAAAVRPVVASATGAATATPATPKAVRVAAAAPLPPVRPVDAPRPPADIKTVKPQAVAAAAPVAKAPVKEAAKEPVKDTIKPVASSANGWVIQLGATDDESKAKAMLARAKEKSRSTLAKASPFTEKVNKGGATLFRARFAGFDADAAQAACRTLKRDGFSCFASRG